MKIYLINPPFVDGFVRCGRWQGVAARNGTLYYPIWLSYAAGVLENAGHTIKLIDAIASKLTLEDIILDAVSFNPGLIVIDSNFSSLNNDIRISNLLKKRTGAVTILVGPPASQFPEKILNDGVDIVARYEYDLTLLDIANSFDKNGHLDSIKGVSFKSDCRIIHNSNRKFLSTSQLDELPFVSEIYKKHLNINNYFLGHSLYPMIQIFTGRGCPNRCTFCSWPITLMGRAYRFRSVDNVVDELEYISNELKLVKEVFIEDDTFTANESRTKEICNEILNRNLDITWSCNSRANLNKDEMEKMKKAGCRLLDVGYESGSNEILRNIKKGITIEECKKFSLNAKRTGLMILGDFIFGLPGETHETAEATIAFAQSIKPNIIQFSIATPIPGTEFYDWANENNFLLSKDLQDSLDSSGFQRCIVSYPNFTNRDIEKYVDYALKKYYLSPNFIPIALSNILRKNGWHELMGMVSSAKTFSKYILR
jgi:anaerobic magnesium-protoporphyrin IX monomethyl ester cyclase